MGPKLRAKIASGRRNSGAGGAGGCTPQGGEEGRTGGAECGGREEVTRPDTSGVARGSLGCTGLRYPAYDIYGAVHDGAVLRARRVLAVNRGMTFLWKFLKRNKFAALYSIGDDAPSIFFEIWYTSANSSIRSRARDLAVILTAKLETRLLARPAVLLASDAQRDEFFTFMFMLRSQAEMSVDTSLLMAAADASWARNGFSDTTVLYGCSREDLVGVSTEAWLELLMRILIMEYNNLVLFQNRFPCTFGLHDAFSALRHVKLSSFDSSDEGKYQDSFYLATHIVYAISAYSGIKTHEKDVPWLYRYLRRSLLHWMRQAQRKRKDPSVYVDVDGVGEIADLLRGLGLSETTDKMVCTCTDWLLATQQEDGSWPVWFNAGDSSDKHDYYDRMHSTWVCTQALRDRDFKVNEKQVQKWKTHMAKLLSSSQLRKLAYKCTW